MFLKHPDNFIITCLLILVTCSVGQILPIPEEGTSETLAFGIRRRRVPFAPLLPSLLPPPSVV